MTKNMFVTNHLLTPVCKITIISMVACPIVIVAENTKSHLDSKISKVHATFIACIDGECFITNALGLIWLNEVAVNIVQEVSIIIEGICIFGILHSNLQLLLLSFIVEDSLWNSVRISDGELVGYLNVHTLIDLPSSETVVTKVGICLRSYHSRNIFCSLASRVSENIRFSKICESSIITLPISLTFNTNLKKWN